MNNFLIMIANTDYSMARAHGKPNYQDITECVEDLQIMKEFFYNSKIHLDKTFEFINASKDEV